MRKPVALSIAIAALCSCAWGAEPSPKLDELRKERREVDKEIRKAVPNPNDRDPQLAKLQEASLEALRAYEKAINDHPALQAIKKEMETATSKLTTAVASGDMNARETAKQELSVIMNRRSELAAKEPDLQALMKANNDAGAAYFAKRKELLASWPETKANAAKLEELNARIQEELRKQR
ncbi:MAG: hypothetical protein EOP87_23130 [Verrucomicrobiaceae bacterium]|nr:MAG: hypothetical protein EOP87_23130 [Verrucomicrobiaceae bacterium]